ncbi:hypothetical protein RND71_040371 [Anisodus tanguticus]|uniref:Uncharacterized protein n=1 Tax=Anisodus tanguticus TaxID=243964 RepID=A0AAE1QS15_9SOLA|nr:hypothetical protein RND71_040371 [Anisodus tanguticus]
MKKDIYNLGEEYDCEEESRPEFLCPFCAEDFDIVGLCCHIDEEHAVEAKDGICPVCAKRAGMDLVGHITQQHGNILKVQRKRRFRRGGTSALSILKRERREGSLQSILGGSSRLVSSSTTDPDPLLYSFIHNTTLANEIPDVQPLSSTKQSSEKESTPENSSERNVEQSPLSDKDQEEKARKSKFVQGLLLSTFLEEDF